MKIKETELNINQKMIKKLEDNKNKLLIIAKDEYKIQKPEEQIEQKKDDKDIEKMRLHIKRKELENNILKKNNIIKKYNIMEKDNQKMIRILEENVAIKSLDLKIRKEEIVKLNEILEKIDIENNNFIFKTEIRDIKTKKNVDKNIHEVIKENEKETDYNINNTSETDKKIQNQKV